MAGSTTWASTWTPRPPSTPATRLRWSGSARTRTSVPSPPEGHAMSPLPAPLNLQAWIEQNRHLLKPPVGNKCIHDGDFIVMVVGGPNARTDFHLDEGPEWFYQLEGEMVLRVQERVEGGPDSLREIPIRAGEVFLLPAGVPHSPQRMAGGVGLVIERKRLAHERDGLLWYCE